MFSSISCLISCHVIPRQHLNQFLTRSSVGANAVEIDAQLKSLLLSSLKTCSTFIIVYELGESIFISLKRCDSRIECATFEDECSERAGCLKKPEVCDLFPERKV